MESPVVIYFLGPITGVGERSPLNLSRILRQRPLWCGGHITRQQANGNAKGRLQHKMCEVSIISPAGWDSGISPVCIKIEPHFFEES